MQQNKMKNTERENRIYNEIIVDCYDEEEQKMGWYYYLEENTLFRFKAEANFKKRNRTKIKQKVDVLQLSSNEGFENDLLIGVCYHEDIFDVPLLILLNIKANEKTIEAIEDWRYWNSK